MIIPTKGRGFVNQGSTLLHEPAAEMHSLEVDKDRSKSEDGQQSAQRIVWRPAGCKFHLLGAYNP